MDARIGTSGRSRSSSFGPGSCWLFQFASPLEFYPKIRVVIPMNIMKEVRQFFLAWILCKLPLSDDPCFTASLVHDAGRADRPPCIAGNGTSGVAVRINQIILLRIFPNQNNHFHCQWPPIDHTAPYHWLDWY